MSLPEVVLWDCLRAGRLGGLRFRRQHPIGSYVLDFYCPAAKLAVEVDGAHHDLPGQIYRDQVRDGWLAGEGVRVMRVAATDVLEDRALEGTLAMIANAAAGIEVFGVAPPPPPSAVPLPRKRGRIKVAYARSLDWNEKPRKPRK